MLKLLLIYPSYLYASYWGKRPRIKSHMINLFSFLKYNKINVEVLDLENEIGRPENENQIKKFREKATSLISKFDFDIAAISCWTSLNYLSSIMIAEICKNVNIESIVVVGGYHPSALPSDFMYSKSPFDFIIRGEGEIALLKIAKGEEKRGNKSKLIQGTALRLREDFVLDWQNYKYSERSRVNSIYLSRGCPFSCAFCMESTKGYHRWESYSVEQAIREINRLIDIKKPRQISISDACFGFNETWRKEFLCSLIKNKIDKIFWAESRIDLFDKADIDLLSKLNFNMDFGLESGSKEMLGIMKKTNKPSEYLKKCEAVITYMNKKEVPYRIYLVFNHPGETYTTYTSTIKFIRSLIKRQNKISGIFVGQNYAFFPGSYVHNYLKYYEKKYGTVVKCKEWWKEQGEHSKLARFVIPSKDLMNKFGAVGYWQEEILDLYRQCYKKMPIWVRFFWQVKTKTFKEERLKKR